MTPALSGAITEVPALLSLAGVRKSFGAVQALRGVDFALHAGEVHALLGENGAGKSTLIKLITGAHRADAGRIVVGGHEEPRLDPRRAKALGIAAVYQQPSLFRDLSVAENLALGSERPGLLRWIDWPRRRRMATEVLDRIGADIDPGRVAGSLSMAEQQLVEIARALLTGARILILDEPTAALPSHDATRLLDLVRGLRSTGIGIIYISHRLDEVAAIADRATVLRDGTSVGTLPMQGLSSDAIIRLMVGRPVAELHPKRQVTIGAAVLECRGLGCTASGVAAIDLTVRSGEIVGLAGLVGAGRSELARVLFGLTPADAGTILLDGRPLAIDRPDRAIAAGIAYLPEDRRRHGVIPAMTVSENTAMAVLRRHLVRFGFLRRAAESSLAEDAVKRFAVRTAGIDAPVETLSGGNQQKVAFARWLATRPRVVILDEPTQGVDVGAKSEIHQIIGDLVAEGVAVILISSDLPEVLGLSDRVAVLRQGRIADILERAEATPERVLSLALGRAA
ncbi:ribose import ATP-binding protein RbsA 1 [Planctomycetota bacterium]|nr:ribose import ATP-binding protein RbsA 1 [Planctomycetota bacterium]